MALVIVLSVLVLLTIMVVGFLNRATIDRTSASAYSDGDRNSLLSDYAVNIVQAQIDHASTRTNTAWASQPGLVRTFAQDGSLLQAYKLYSDSGMVTNVVDLSASTNAMANWSNSPAHFVDLNEPVEIEGRKEFPIIDPSALDKKTDGSPMIEGFEVTGAPDASARQPIPMPVRWLYVLEDGQTVAPSNVGGSTAAIPGATEENPIVSRIAFWTDDETCKLNINTASHGQFWDIPRAFSLDERDRMARFQPALGEYQRYPGHPASTSLWPVLGYKIPTGGKTPIEIDRDFGRFVYPLVPRVQEGGSEGGTRFATSTAIDKTKDIDRLYASTDELLFSSFKELNGPLDGTRAEQTGLDRSDIERTKFFLTARSNSPEVNLFNLPRMAIWPINAGAKTPSTLDKLLAFCSTINNQKYYLQRSDSTSGTADMLLDSSRNGKLYNYINSLLNKPFPGFGNTSFAAKYTEPETAQITTSIFDYIRSSNLYSTALGASAFTGAGTNPYKTQGSRAGQATPLQIGATKGFGRIPAISQAILHLYVCGMRSAKGDFSLDGTYPLKTGNTPLYADSFSAGNYQSIRNFLDDTGAGNPVELLIGGIVYFDMFDPMQGNAVPRYNFDIEVSFSGGWQITGPSLAPQSMGFQNATLNINRDHQGLWSSKLSNWAGTYNGRIYGGALGPLFSMGSYTHLRDDNASNNALEYPLVSNRLAVGQKINLVTESAKVTLPDSATTDFGNVIFSGGTVTAKIKAGGNVVQTYTFDFPPFTKPAPAYAWRGYLRSITDPIALVDPDLVLKQLATSADFRHRWAHQAYANRRNPAAAGGAYCDLWLIQDMDTIVALEPAYGDKRILAARQLLTTGSLGGDGKVNPVDANFVPNKDYDSPSVKIAADFRNEPFGSDRRIRAFENHRKPGRILDLVYGGNAMPLVPSRYPNGVKDTTDGGFWPDFDNGVLHTEDDAYVNRADEGTVSSSIDDDSIGTGTGDRGFPWYRNELFDTLDVATFFSPNKQMPSAGMFGSLPTGAVRNKPWQTLLFRPDPGNHPGASAPEDYLLLDLFWMPVVEPYAISERFSSNGKVNMNYQILPFGYLHRSTALRGALQKQEIVSIDNLWAYKGTPDSSTGYAGVLKSGVAVDDEYKMVSFGTSVASFSNKIIRRTLNLSKDNGTLKTFEDLFARNGIFRSETQICSVPLVPSDATLGTPIPPQTLSAKFERDYWDSRRLTGDNSREMPYTQLLPRLTTRSNTYTVHYRVQNLKKAPSTDHAVWTEGKDKVTSELRGSRTIERYLDPNDGRIPDYAADSAATPALDAFYRWRTLYNRTFAP